MTVCWRQVYMSPQALKLAGSGLLNTESPLRDLAALIRSRVPLIAVESNEEPQVVALVRQIAVQLHLKAFRWTITEGMEAFDPVDRLPQLVLTPQEVLSFIKANRTRSLFVLLDFNKYLEDPVHVRFLKDIALTFSSHQSTVVLVASSLPVPDNLRSFTAYFRLPLPTADELRSIVYDVAGEWGRENGWRDVRTTNKALDMLVRNLTGLTITDARRLARKAISENGVISESELPEVGRAKYELLGRDSPLTFENETAQFAEIGGMARLRQWLDVRKVFFREDPPEHLDPPKGMLLLGVQGCGKSLAAKAAAGIFGVSLLRFDFGVLYSKYYGETEQNVRRALDIAQVMAPCVLWLDEIEKGLAVGGDDDGLSRRVLATLLTWMSEKKKPVFVVATANDITRLPPEMVRKGRFDEIFFVDLPSASNRKDIFAIHLKKRLLEPKEFNLEELALVSEGFSGAEIEQAVVSAMYTAHAAHHELTEEELVTEIKQTRPLSVVMSEKVEELREWAKGRTVPSD